MATVVVYGADFTKNGLLGPETKKRCKKAASWYRGNNTRFIMTPEGYAPFFKGPKHEQSMASMMKEFLELIGIPSESIIAEERSWNTLAETLSAINIIEERKLSQEVIVVSSWYHIPRIWYLWKRKGWKVKISASGASHPLWVFLEIPKWVVTLLKMKVAEPGFNKKEK